MSLPHPARLSLFLLGLIFLVPFSPSPSLISSPLSRAALRARDPAGDAPLPAADFLALYLRRSADDLEIRFDFLDLSPLSSPGIVITLQNTAMIPATTVAIVIPSTNPVQVWLSNAGEAAPPETLAPARIRLVRDPLLDTISLHLDLSALPPSLTALGFSLSARSYSPSIDLSMLSTISDLAQFRLDQIGPVRSDAPPPSPTQFSLVFSQALPARTPAQALRRWDGAHTGPLGSRHGLRYLLSAAAAYHIPLGLYNVEPTALNALHIAIQPGAARWSRQNPPSDLFPALPPGDQLDATGLTLAARAAFANQDKLIMGGDFASGLWGDPQIVQTALYWIANHPWIQPMSAPAPTALPTPSSTEPDFIMDFETLLAASPPPLSTIYAGYLGDLDAGADWKSSLSPINRCSRDLDHDGRAECILASSNLFAVVEAEQSSLTLLFSQAGGRLHQIIAPSFQFAIGLSDPSQWDVEAGFAADPSAITSFAEPTESSWQIVPCEANALCFASGQREKIYRLLPDGLELIYRQGPLLPMHLSLALDGWLRSQPGGLDRRWNVSTATGWDFGLSGFAGSDASGPALHVTVESSVPLNLRSSVDSLALLRLPEDPNYPYPDGHFLPFPLAVLDLPTAEALTIRLYISPVGKEK